MQEYWLIRILFLHFTFRPYVPPNIFTTLFPLKTGQLYFLIAVFITVLIILLLQDVALVLLRMAVCYSFSCLWGAGAPQKCHERERWCNDRQDARICLSQ